MPMLEYNGHRIEVRNSWLGLEQVYYDGREISRKRTLAGGSHVFSVTENGEKVVYEVELQMGLIGYTTTIRRNGIAIFTDR